MSTTTAISGNPVKNNSAAIAYAGSIASVENVGLGNNAQGGGSVVPPSGLYSPTWTAIDSGTFANLEGGNQVIAMRATSTIAGLANTALRSGAADAQRKSVNALTTRQTVHITGWNYATGAVLASSGVTDSFGADYAADDGRAAPGSIVIMENGKTASTKSY